MTRDKSANKCSVLS